MKKIFLFLIICFNISFSNENKKAFDVEGNKYIFRTFYGIARAGKFYELAWNPQEDPNHGKIIGIQLERYVYRQVLDFPVNITLQTSYIIHKNYYSGSDSYYTDKDSNEFNFGVKIYWTKFPWDKYVRTRIGASEGLSYIDRITNLERYNQEHNSNILNYIDLTASFNLRDITTLKFLEDSFLGVGVSHRSDIFGTINDVNGGSNKITIFFETEF